MYLLCPFPLFCPPLYIKQLWYMHVWVWHDARRFIFSLAVRETVF